METNQAEHVGRSLLALYATVEAVGFADFQESAFELVKREIDFDAGIWGTGAMLDGQPKPHHIHLHRREMALMASWEKVKHEDVIIGQALGYPGRPIRTSLSDPIWDKSPGVRAHCRQHGIGHVLCTFVHDSHTGLYHFISVYRTPAEPPFGERDEGIKRLLAPHLAQAVNMSRLRHLRATASGRGMCAQLAVVDREGVIYEAEPGFFPLLEAEWPGWQGPRLPAAITDLASDGECYTGERVVIVGSTVKDMYVLSARTVSPIDRLSRREFEIAQLYGRGIDHKEIARKLCISPATVRNHVQAIYLKVGLQDKAQLAAQLHSLGLDTV